MKKYDVIIVGAGPGGIFSAYELVTNNSEIKVAVFEKGHLLEKRKCPIDGDKVKNCISCKTCSIMSGFGGRQVQHNKRFRRHALRTYRQEKSY